MSKKWAVEVLPRGLGELMHVPGRDPVFAGPLTDVIGSQSVLGGQTKPARGRQKQTPRMKKALQFFVK